MPALTSQALRAMAAAQALVERDQALGNLLDALDPGRVQSLNTLAHTITRMMQTHAAGLARIEAGGRAPRDGAEAALLVLRRTGCPSSPRHMYRVLVDLLG